MNRAEGRANAKVLRQECVCCASRNSKENSCGWSGVIREERNRRQRVRQGQGGKNDHIEPYGPLRGLGLGFYSEMESC